MASSSRTAIKKFVIDNTSTTIPTGVTLFSTITAVRFEPKVEKLGTNVYCWLGETRRSVSRFTLGRGTGQKTAVWNVQVMLIATASDEQNGMDQFQAIVDSIATSYEGISLSPPPTITDPLTGGQTQVLIIGENWSDVMYRPELTADQGRAVFRAVITVPVTEYLTAA